MYTEVHSLMTCRSYSIFKRHCHSHSIHYRISTILSQAVTENYIRWLLIGNQRYVKLIPNSNIWIRFKKLNSMFMYRS